MRCHTLVWYSQLPSWGQCCKDDRVQCVDGGKRLTLAIAVSSGSWTKDSLTKVINTHITNVMGQFKGQCYAWDVVNEALEDDGSYRKSVFWRVLGDTYFAIAFKQAAATDPGAKLYYNDCKRIRIIRVCKIRLRKQSTDDAVSAT